MIAEQASRIGCFSMVEDRTIRKKCVAWLFCQATFKGRGIQYNKSKNIWNSNDNVKSHDGDLS